MKKNNQNITEISSVIFSTIILSFCVIHVNSSTLYINSFLQITIVFLSILSLHLIDKKKEKIEKISSINIISFIVFLSSIVISSTISNETHKSITRFVLIFGISFFAFYIFISSRNPQKLLQGLSISVILITIVSTLYNIAMALYDFNLINKTGYLTVTMNFAGIELHQNIAYRAFRLNQTNYYIQRFGGIFPNPNGMGIMSAMTFFLAYTSTENKKIRMTIQAISLIGLIMSISRMGFLLFSTALIYYHLHHNRIRQIIISVMLIVLMLFLFGTATSTPATIATPLKPTPISQQELLQLSERAQMISMAWQGFLEHWFVGVGYGVGAEYLFKESADVQAVHSVHLNAMLETGIIGTLALFLIWLTPVFTTPTSNKRIEGRIDHRHVIAALLFGLFFAEAFDLSVTRFHYIHIIFVFFIGCWFALGHVLKDKT